MRARRTAIGTAILCVVALSVWAQGNARTGAQRIHIDSLPVLDISGNGLARHDQLRGSVACVPVE